MTVVDQVLSGAMKLDASGGHGQRWPASQGTLGKKAQAILRKRLYDQ